MLNDPLANILSLIDGHGKIGRSHCMAKPVSKLILEVLKIMKDGGYIKECEVVENSRGGFISISLSNYINKCSVIKPRHAVGKDEFEKFEKRFLPAKGFGILIVSTVQGIMTQDQAKEKRIGGRLLAYCY